MFFFGLRNLNCHNSEFEKVMQYFTQGILGIHESHHCHLRVLKINKLKTPCFSFSHVKHHLEKFWFAVQHITFLSVTGQKEHLQFFNMTNQSS